MKGPFERRSAHGRAAYDVSPQGGRERHDRCQTPLVRTIDHADPFLVSIHGLLAQDPYQDNDIEQDRRNDLQRQLLFLNPDELR